MGRLGSRDLEPWRDGQDAPTQHLCLLPLALNLLGNVSSRSLSSPPDACGALTIETMSI